MCVSQKVHFSSSLYVFGVLREREREMRNPSFDLYSFCLLTWKQIRHTSTRVSGRKLFLLQNFHQIFLRVCFWNKLNSISLSHWQPPQGIKRTFFQETFIFHHYNNYWVFLYIWWRRKGSGSWIEFVRWCVHKCGVLRYLFTKPRDEKRRDNSKWDKIHCTLYFYL